MLVVLSQCNIVRSSQNQVKISILCNTPLSDLFKHKSGVVLSWDEREHVVNLWEHISKTSFIAIENKVVTQKLNIKLA